MTTAEHKAIVKKVTADVMGQLHRQHLATAYHEAGHCLAAHCMSLTIISASAGLSVGSVAAAPPQGMGRERAARANLVWALAGSAAEGIAKAKGLLNEEASAAASISDKAVAKAAAGRLWAITGEPAPRIIEAAIASTVDLLQRHWVAVTEVADRLQRGKSLWHIETYLSFIVPVEKETN